MCCILECKCQRHLCKLNNALEGTAQSELDCNVKNDLVKKPLLSSDGAI